MRLLGARRVAVRPPRGGYPRSPADLPGREPPEAGPASSRLQPAGQWGARPGPGGRGWAGPAPGTPPPSAPTGAGRGERATRGAGGVGRGRWRRQLRPVLSPVGTRRRDGHRRPLTDPRGKGRNQVGVRGTQCALPPPEPVDGARTLRAHVPFRSRRPAPGAGELSAPVVLNQALRKRSR